MDRRVIVAAAILGMTAVVLGAFGAHWLKNNLDVAELSTFETGVRYQMYHALLLLFIGSVSIRQRIRSLLFILIVAGVFLFSGSIYLLATNSLTNFDFRVIGFVTPIGGLLLIIAWLLIMFEFMRKKNIKKN